jgi:hypothetical protein
VTREESLEIERTKTSTPQRNVQTQALVKQTAHIELSPKSKEEVILGEAIYSRSTIITSLPTILLLIPPIVRRS